MTQAVTKSDDNERQRRIVLATGYLSRCRFLERNFHLRRKSSELFIEPLFSQPMHFLEEVEPTDRSGTTITTGENIDGHFETGLTL